MHSFLKLNELWVTEGKLIFGTGLLILPKEHRSNQRPNPRNFEIGQKEAVDALTMFMKWLAMSNYVETSDMHVYFAVRATSDKL